MSNKSYITANAVSFSFSKSKIKKPTPDKLSFNFSGNIAYGLFINPEPIDNGYFGSVSIFNKTQTISNISGNDMSGFSDKHGGYDYQEYLEIIKSSTIKIPFVTSSSVVS